MILTETDSRTSSVFCLKAMPQTAMRLLRSTQSFSRMRASRRGTCCSLMASTSRRMFMGSPNCSETLMKPLTSFGKQEPP